MIVRLRNRQDALIWRAVDAIFTGADARTVCAELELDLNRERAERLLTQCDRLVALLRETDPNRIPIAEDSAA